MLRQVAFGSFAFLVSAKALAAAPCTQAQLDAIRAPASGSDNEALVTCNGVLNPGDIITRALVFEGDSADGVTFDCNGAWIEGNARDQIQVRSIVAGFPDPNNEGGVLHVNGHPVPAKLWSTLLYNRQRPENVTIRNCNVRGSIRIWGLGTNGQEGYMWFSSRDITEPNHVIRARDAAPNKITFDNIRVEGNGRIPFYVAPGVTEVTLMNSRIRGTAKLGIYLDAESSNNRISHNDITVNTVTNDGDTDREQIAIDGSSSNRIFSNYISGLSNGGIYLYRNCGEGGVVRYSTPSRNQIVNNVFYYRNYTGPNPSVFLGQRNGVVFSGNCPEDNDAGVPLSFNSSVTSNLDFAANNVVAQNQIYRPGPQSWLKIGSSTTDAPNFITLNQLVSTPVSRLAGCYMPNHFSTEFALHGEVITHVALTSGFAVDLLCNDNTFSTFATNTTPVDFSCKISGNNNGQNCFHLCPSGTKLVGVTAACDLETGAVSDTDLSTVTVGQLKVTRVSDNPSDGRCYVGVANQTISSGSAIAHAPKGMSGLNSGCREVDSNGGDCEVRGKFYCR